MLKALLFFICCSFSAQQKQKAFKSCPRKLYFSSISYLAVLTSITRNKVMQLKDKKKSSAKSLNKLTGLKA